jgi:hypothetical protein
MTPLGIASMSLGEPGQARLDEGLGEQLGDPGQATLAAQLVDRVAEAGLECRRGPGGQGLRLREGEDQPLAGDAESTRRVVETQQDDLLSEWIQLCRDGCSGGWRARVGGAEGGVVAAAGRDLNAEDGRHEEHGDEWQCDAPHENLRSRKARAGASASSASPAATRKEVRNACVAARVS